MPRLHCVGLVLFVALIASGCLEREERLVIAPDGSVEVSFDIEGDGADLDGGAARLPVQAPFVTERLLRWNGKEDKHVLLATARFASVDDLPRHFGGPEDALAAEVGLSCSTRLHVRRVGSGVEYTFVREYEPRTFWALESLRRQYFTDEIEELTSRFDELQPGQRRRVMTALQRFERDKYAHWTGRAVSALDLDDEVQVRAALAARRAVRAHFEQHLGVDVMEQILALDEDGIARRVDEVQERLTQLASAAVAAQVPLTPEQQELFLATLQREREAYNVTSDLNDERFEVHVTLPGVLLDDNGAAREGSTVSWAFDGKQLWDQPRVLMARSVLDD